MSSLQEKKFLQLIKFSFDLSVKVTRTYTKTNVLHRYNNSFVDFLNANKHEIYHLWNNNTRCCVCTSNVLLKQNRDLNKDQFTKLFDINGNATPGHFRKVPGKSIGQYCFCGISCLPLCSLDDLDVILIYTLLRKFVKLNPDDEMWLDTVRQIRNKLAHAVSTTCFDQGRLTKWWSKLEGSVLGLASKIPIECYEDLVKDQIKLLGIADFNINDGEIKNLIKTENEKLYDKIITEHENKFQQVMNKQDLYAKDTKDKSETDKQEIIKHIKQTKDDLYIEIKKVAFKCTLYNVETEVKPEMMETTPYKTEAKQTIIKQDPSEHPSSEDQNVQSEQTITKCKQEPSQNPSSENLIEQYSDICQVEWKLKTPDTWRVEQIKRTLENVSELLRQWFHIELIYVGSLVIHTSVPRYVLRDKQFLKLAIQSFLEKIVEVCEINTDVAETVNVDFRVLGVISSTEAVKSKFERMTKLPLYSERTLEEDNRRKIQTMTEPPYTMLRHPGDGDGVQIISPKEYEAEHRQITNDPIHGIIQLHPLCVRIIDTPQFQRLRNIKQLGGCYFTYPGASHNRFEHSIGVCHLAGELARHLQNRIGKDIEKLGRANPNYAEKLKEAEMTDEDVLCIEIAGLCHDLGHGPFSHLFDMLFNKAMQKKNPDAEIWTHEHVSREMFKHMIEENASVKKAMKDMFGTDIYQDKVVFVLNLITGEVPENEKVKKYMYEIVANSRHGIDVDKMDYFARDCHGLGIKSNFDHVRYISQCRVMFVDENSTETTIAVRDKEQFNLYELFHTRVGLFRRAYFHKVTKAVEIMLTEALVEADDFIQIPITGGDHVKMSEAWKNMSAYQKLTDSIFDSILMSEDDNLKKAKNLITRIYKRELYRLVYESEPQQTFKKDFVEKLEKHILSAGYEEGFTMEDFTIQAPVFNYGKKEKNPIEDVYFYKKGEDMSCSPMGKPEKLSLFLPSEIFQEQVIRVYTKSDEKAGTLKRLAEKSYQHYNAKRLKQSTDSNK